MRHFSWQEGYGAFSYSKSHISQVAKYIETQEKHHKKKMFLDEYRQILNGFELEMMKNIFSNQLKNKGGIPAGCGGDYGTKPFLPSGDILTGCAVWRLWAKPCEAIPQGYFKLTTAWRRVNDMDFGQQINSAS
jgi:hypothetical protein